MFNNLLDIIKENIGNSKGVKIHCNTITKSILITHNDPEFILEVNDWFIEHFSILRVIPDYGHDPKGADLGEYGSIKDAWLMVYE